MEKRTKIRQLCYSKKQLLELSFQDNPHPNQKEKQRLAQAVNMDERAIGRWFDTRRFNEKKKKKRQDDEDFEGSLSRKNSPNTRMSSKTRLMNARGRGRGRSRSRSRSRSSKTEGFLDKKSELKPRGRPPKMKRLLDREYPNIVDSAVCHVKKAVDITKHLKRKFEDFPSFMSSSHAYECYATMLHKCTDTYRRSKESCVASQNEYEDFNGTFRVFLRVKPALPGETLLKFDFINNPNSVTSSRRTETFAKFDHVFSNNESQGDVFEEIKPLVQRFVQGSNLCVLAYGQSGSGKTYSMFGPSKNGILMINNVQERGLCVLAVEEMFFSMKQDRNIKWSVVFEMVEIYKNGINSLVDSIEVKSLEETLEILAKGFRKRVWHGTQLNAQSSRSHCLVDFKLEGKAANGETIRGCLQMVDLAGNGKLDLPTEESKAITMGLLCLEMVIESLSTNEVHIPYNNHNLTRLLASSLGEKSKVVFLAHVSAVEKYMSETMRTLVYANKASKIQNGVIQLLNKDLRKIRERLNKTESLSAVKSSTNQGFCPGF